MIETWINRADVDDLSWVTGRNLFSRACKNLSTREILSKSVYLSPEDSLDLIEVTEGLHPGKIVGKGVELGSGVGIFSSLLSKRKSVDTIYSVELVPEMILDVQPRIVEEFGDAEKIVCALGSFDEMKLDNCSIDFVFEYNSLHHSFDLIKTLKESARVLRENGALIAIDRVNSDAMTEGQKNRLLDFKYPDKWLNENYYEVGTGLTRRENGEHEIRESEWRDALTQAGFKNISITMIVKPSFRVYLYSLIALIPDGIKKYTPYRYLSAFSFSKVITSLWHRRAIPENAGKFVGCLGGLKDKNTKKIKTIHVIYAEKGSA